MNKGIFWMIVILITIIGFGASYFTYTNLSRRPQFPTVDVTSGNIAGALNISGKIVPREEVNLGFEQTGKITQLSHAVGDRVREGEILARLDDANYNYQLEQAQYGVLSAKEYLDQLEKTLKKDELKRKEMKNDNTVKSTDKKIQDQQIKLSEEAIDAQKYQIEAAKTNLASISNQMEKTIIKAPRAGIISKQDIKVGEVASSGTPVITLISADDFKIEANVSQLDLSGIVIGQKAKITFDSLGSDHSIEALVVSIDPAENENGAAVSYKVTLEFKENSSEIRSGMDVNISLVQDNKQNVILIPFNAVFRENGKNYVFRLSNGNFEKVEVVLGVQEDDQKVEVVSGISNGDKVIVPGK